MVIVPFETYETAENWNTKVTLVMDDNIPKKILSVDNVIIVFNVTELGN
jgi:hypothetical protein